MNIAVWCRRQRDLLESQLKVVPTDMERMHALAQAELTLGNLAKGFELFDARLLDRLGRTDWAPAEPRWIGQPADQGYDGTLLVQPEQGLGDAIMMARYVPLLKQRWAQVVMEVRPPLYRLFRENFGECVIPLRAKPIEYDFAVPMLSLPGVFKTTEATIPKAPYLQAESQPVLKSSHIGIAWAGAPWHRNTNARNIPARYVEELIQQTSGQWVSLQVDQLEQFGIPSIRGMVKDVADTAAIVTSLSLVVTCDTMVAHLAGALGVPCWVLLPFVPDWRWQLHRKDSPWYPSIRLFRQEKPGDWAGVIQRVIQTLQE